MGLHDPSPKSEMERLIKLVDDLAYAILIGAFMVSVAILFTGWFFCG